MANDLWRKQAACYGMGGNAFDHDTWHRPALELCRTCPVKTECLGDALDRKQAADCGVWGFTSLAQRERIRQRHTTPQNVWSYNEQRIDRERAKEEEASLQSSLFADSAKTSERLVTVDRLFMSVGG
jgi:hypothetical protein